MAKKKAPAVLKKITSRAKALRRKHPTAKWTNLIKQASREIKGKAPAKAKRSKRRVSSVKYIDKGEAKNVRPSKVYRIQRSKKGTFKGYKRVAGATVAQHVSAAKELLLNDMARLSARKMVATKKRIKNKLQKQISEKRTQYNRLKV